MGCTRAHPHLLYGVPSSGRLVLSLPSLAKYAPATAAAVGIELISPMPFAPYAAPVAAAVATEAPVEAGFPGAALLMMIV
jgi:hypothetical protein